jgi:hypothetical protein
LGDEKNPKLNFFVCIKYRPTSSIKTENQYSCAIKFPPREEEGPQLEEKVSKNFLGSNNLKKKKIANQARVAHTCDLSYFGARSGGLWFEVSSGK